MASQRYPEAQNLFDQAIRAKPDFAPAYLGRCKALNALKRPLEAIAACNDALAYRAYYPEAVRTKRQCHRATGQATGGPGPLRRNYRTDARPV